MITDKQKVEIYERFLSRLQSARLVGSEERIKMLFRNLDTWYHARQGGELTEAEIESNISSAIEGLVR